MSPLSPSTRGSSGRTPTGPPLPQVQLGLLKIARRPVGHGKRIVDPVGLRNPLQRGFKMGNRLGRALPGNSRFTESVSRGRGIGIQLQRRLELFPGIRRAIQLEIDAAEPDSTRRVPGIHPSGGFIICRRFFQASGALVQFTRQMPPAVVVGRQAAGVSIASEGGIREFVSMIKLPQQAVGIGQFRIGDPWFSGNLDQRLLNSLHLPGDGGFQRIQRRKGHRSQPGFRGCQHRRRAFGGLRPRAGADKEPGEYDGEKAAF